MANTGEQHPGCKVELNSADGPQLPVCLGGSAIRGCNNAGACIPRLRQPGIANRAVMNPDNPDLVQAVYEVRRDVLVPADFLVPGLQ